MKMINIGPVVLEQLKQIGINNLDQLQAVGSCEAWLKIQEFDSSACYNRLCALEGAIQGIRWHDLSVTDKKKLKEFYQKHKI